MANKIDSAVDAAGRAAFGMSRSEARALGICVMCHKPATSFTDALSAREFQISQLCQLCQDRIFGALKG